MSDKINLAKQNQYVEFAEKDAEGNDIAEGIKGAQSDIDRLSGVYTYASIGISGIHFIYLNPQSNPKALQPVTIAIGDIADGVELTADKIQELFDANIVTLSCNDLSTNYPTIVLQRMYIDAPNYDLTTNLITARFESVVMLDSKVYRYTMNVTPYNPDNDEGGSITIACTPMVTGTTLYKHEVLVAGDPPFLYPTDGYLRFRIVTDNPEPFTGFGNDVLSFLINPNIRTIQVSNSDTGKYIKFASTQLPVVFSVEATYPQYQANYYSYYTEHTFPQYSNGTAIAGYDPYQILPVTKNYTCDLSTGKVTLGVIYGTPIVSLIFVQDNVTKL